MTDKQLQRLQFSGDSIKKSMLRLGCAMKPAADKIVEALKEFEKLKNKADNSHGSRSIPK